ncbi:oligo-1,6-glucosidase, partial [Streptomyces europaeiscabiei]|nr:oligo-1,6-glucosidase [Streptomyces europaeiscabiei]
PVDPSPDRPTVAAQRADDTSLLHLVHRLIALRRRTPELGSGGSVEVLHAGYPFVYVRGGRYLVVVNPQRHEASYSYTPLVHSALEGQGVDIVGGTITARGFGHGIFELGG